MNLHSVIQRVVDALDRAGIGVIAVNHQTLDGDYLDTRCELLGTAGSLRELWTTASSAS